jgi:hypothetical protein
MSSLPGLHNFRRRPSEEPSQVHVVRVSELRKILAFAGWSIDDVIDNPIARKDVARWFKLGRWMTRRLEISDLESQWNPHK